MRIESTNFQTAFQKSAPFAMRPIELVSLFPKFDKFCKKFETSFDSKCSYQWNEITARPFFTCIEQYKNYNKLGCLEKISFKIREIFYSIIGKSVWQLAQNRLSAYIFFVHQLNNGNIRPLAGVKEQLQAGRYSNMAENVMRYLLGYQPKIKPGIPSALLFDSDFYQRFEHNLDQTKQPGDTGNLVKELKLENWDSTVSAQVMKSIDLSAIKIFHPDFRG